MMRRLKGSAVILVGLVLLAMTSSAWAQSPSAATDTGAAAQLVATKVISPTEQKAALAFWSRQAMAAAQPLALPVQVGPAAVDQAAPADSPAIGRPGFVAAGAAAKGSERALRAAYPNDWAAIDAARDNAALAGSEADAALDESLIGPAGTSQVYTAYTANLLASMQTIYPHRWIGRLSFSTPAGTSYCSATAISGNVMLTAAHCLYDSTNNRWYSNWVFSPAYRGVAAPTTPFGTFAATQCWVLTAWVNLTGNYAINTWARHDVGVCKMGRNTAGLTLNGAVGWMGRQWNFPYVRHLHDLGYPFRSYTDALLPSAGLYLRACAAETFLQTTETRGMGCSFGRGISGGPWVANYAPGAVSGNADGVNSGLFIGTQNLYAARFNSVNIVPLCTAAVC